MRRYFPRRFHGQDSRTDFPAIACWTQKQATDWDRRSFHCPFRTSSTGSISLLQRHPGADGRPPLLRWAQTDGNRAVVAELVTGNVTGPRDGVFGAARKTKGRPDRDMRHAQARSARSRSLPTFCWRYTERRRSARLVHAFPEGRNDPSFRFAGLRKKSLIRHREPRGGVRAGPRRQGYQ